MLGTNYHIGITRSTFDHIEKKHGSTLRLLGFKLYFDAANQFFRVVELER